MSLMLPGHTPGTINQSKHGLILPNHNVQSFPDAQSNFTEIEAWLGRLPLAKSYYKGLTPDQAAIGTGTTAIPGLDTVFYTYDPNTEVILSAAIQYASTLGGVRPVDQYFWWNRPWGSVGYANDATARNSGINNINANVFPVLNFTAVTGRRYRCMWHSAYVTPPGANQVIVQWCNGAGGVIQNAVVSNSAVYTFQSAFMVVDCPAVFPAGAASLRIDASSNTAAAWVYQTATYGAYLSVEDVGPSAGTPANVDPYMYANIDGVNVPATVQYGNLVNGGNGRYTMVDRVIIARPGPHTVNWFFVNGTVFGDTYTIQGPPSHSLVLALS